MDFYTGYFVIPTGVIPGEAIELAQPTGDTIERPTQSAVMVDVLGSEGNPTGGQRFDHWLIGGEDGTETETVEVMRGGWTRVEEAGGDVAMIVLSTYEILDEIAALDDVLEIDRYDVDDDEEPAPTEDIAPMAAPMAAPDKPDKDKPDKRTKASKVKAAKIAEIEAKLAKKNMRPVPPGLDDSGVIVEHVYGEFKHGWKLGMDTVS